MALTPQYAAVPRLETAQVSVSNANRDGTGTIVTVLTAGANGTRVRSIRVNALVTTTLGMVRIFLHDGANARLLFEFPVSVVVAGGSSPAFSASLLEGLNPELPLTLEAGQSLRASTHNSEAFNVTIEGADL
jgi:hypothetical protein